MTSKATQWAAHVAAWKRSGVGQAVFCRDHGLSLSSFGYWRRKCGAKGAARRPARTAQALVPVRVAAPPAPTSAEVCVPNGLRLRVPLDCDPRAVGALVRALLAC